MTASLKTWSRGAPRALGREPYKSLALGGPVAFDEVGAFLGLSAAEIHVLTEHDVFPRGKFDGASRRLFFNCKKLVAYLWGLHHNVRLAGQAAQIIGYRPSDWAC